MSAPPRFKGFRAEDFGDAPEWLELLLTRLNEAIGGVAFGLAGRLTRRENMLAGEKVGLVFKTAPTVADTWPVKVKSELSVPVRNLWLSKFERVDGTAIADPYSMTWTLNGSNELELRFQGLSADVEYRVTALYE